MTWQWGALCGTVARNWRINESKKEALSDEVETDRTEDPDAHDPRPVRPAHEPLDAIRRVRELAAQFDEGQMPDLGDEVLDCVQAGMSEAEISEALGLHRQTVHRRRTPGRPPHKHP